MTINIPHSVLNEIKRLASVHQSMYRRCYDPKSSSFKNYGGRGITICADWHDFATFADWALNNGSEAGLQLDRIDNDGPYSPGNCRFVTAVANMNNRRNSIRENITAFGETKTLKEWAQDERCAVSFSTLNDRVSTLLWPLEKAIITPAGWTRGKKLEAFGEMKTLAEWVRDPRCVVGYPTLNSRYKAGLPLEEAITKPGRRGSNG